MMQLLHDGWPSSVMFSEDEVSHQVSKFRLHPKAVPHATCMSCNCEVPCQNPSVCFAAEGILRQHLSSNSASTLQHNCG